MLNKAGYFLLILFYIPGIILYGFYVLGILFYGNGNEKSLNFIEKFENFNLKKLYQDKYLLLFGIFSLICWVFIGYFIYINGINGEIELILKIIAYIFLSILVIYFIYKIYDNIKYKNQPELVKILLQKDFVKLQNYVTNKGEINILGKDGKIAISYANSQALKYLINNGANINIKDNEGWNLLMIASFNFQVSIVKLLIEYNININETNNEGENALILLLIQLDVYNSTNNIKKASTIIDLLLKNGLNKEIKDNSGKSAIDYAKNKKHIDQLN